MKYYYQYFTRLADDVEEESQRMFCWFLGDIEFKM